VLEYAFETLGKHRVMVSALCDNTRSTALLERTGMKREGRFRQSVWFKGGWADECRYAMLRSEWDSVGLSSS
jgi:RimJ/RimL family protein N-acetyltransferase